MDFTLGLYIKNILFNGLQDTERIDIFTGLGRGFCWFYANEMPVLVFEGIYF